MAKLVLETEARSFIDTYSYHKVPSVAAVANKLITVNRVSEMGGKVAGSNITDLLVDADHLVGYQLPSEGLGNYAFYFSSNSGCNLMLTLSRRVYSASVYDGINDGNHPTLSFIKNSSTSTDADRIGGFLWDQLQVSSKMALTHVTASNPNVPRSYLLNMSLNSTTYGADNTYYKIGTVVITCGQIGSKAIELWYQKYVAPTYSTTVVFAVYNTSGGYQSDISFPWYAKYGSTQVASGTITVSCNAANSTTPISQVINVGSSATRSYTISVGTVSWTQYSDPSSQSGSSRSKTKTISSTILAHYPQTGQQIFNMSLN